MISAIFEILAKGLSIASTWCEQRAKPANVNARVEQDEVKKEDKFSDDLSKKNIESVRAGLSDR